MLFADIVVPPSQALFVKNVEAYAKDQIYGTNTCTMTLDGLLAQMLLLMGVTNNVCGATPAQIQCFLSLLSQSNC
jgi:hypothetical protein